ncbi:ribosomal protection-like ABC-F family protein [Aggregatilinea lenta]|uniref:ribosomal protection-like ABC-F family protein n=1 Tax=Aggregatilinea lenta TaxID=913108 RepID=UPI000E5C4B04|nr:ABC-F family ATP-binding cassette domain-containing protein [Aggregatilinea lenta]
MIIIQLDRITVNYAGRVIFRDLGWAIDERARVGLVGPNGAGKSSLLKVITGSVTPDAGMVIRAKTVSVGYLPQDIDLMPGRTLLDEAMVPPPGLAQVEGELARIEAQLGDPTVYTNPGALTRALERQERALEQYEALGGPRHAGTIRELLQRLGFTPEDYDLPADTLSGGQKKLVALARLAAETPDVLLLDEPDNHLDLASKARLEAVLRTYSGAVVIVSHDRYLLDEVATQIAELENGALTIYPGNYTAYSTERELRRLRQQQAYVAQQKEITRIEEAIKRFEHWASIVVDERHIKQARSRRKMLDRMEANGEIVERVVERRQMELQLNGWRGSTKALDIRDLAMAFEDDLLFTDLSLLLRHGERVGLIGPNGAGKSVLFRLILGELAPLDGEVIVGPSSQIGYYAQEHQTLLPWWDRTPLDLIRDVAPKNESDAIAFLLKMLFTYDQVRQPVRTLSGGERSRLQLAALMLQRPNLLLLDEPTNNLDIPSMEVLEGALEDFEGALLVISHDRYFLDRVVDQVVELDGGALVAYPGGYTDYLAATGRA